MTLLHALPAAAYLGAVLTVFLIAGGRVVAPRRRWMIPAVIGALFIAFSAVTLAEDGLLPFWTNHTANYAGNQVWFDLLSAVAIAFFLIAPRARAVGMPIWPWAVAVIATACVALAPMLAQLLWREARVRD